MGKINNSFPDYEKPPVIEVVCGIQFKTIEGLLIPHFGLLWEKFKSDYPICREVPPLSPVIEAFADSKPVSLKFSDVPPLPRIWFIHKNDNGIIQIQRDRFLHNWRKVREEDEYPRYPNVIKMFQSRLEQFKSFLIENEFEDIEPLQLEITYINHIPKGDGWISLKDIANIFPDFSFRSEDDRFLPEPEIINWRTSFLLPEKLGRFHINIRSSSLVETETPIITLNSTVRGISQDLSPEGMKSWFDLAREWIVRGFVDLTGKEVQEKIWLKKT